MPEETYNTQEAIKAQTALCKEKSYPEFAPYDGKCYRCRHDIYNQFGISVERASTTLITVCPHCKYSFCD